MYRQRKAVSPHQINICSETVGDIFFLHIFTRVEKNHPKTMPRELLCCRMHKPPSDAQCAKPKFLQNPLGWNSTKKGETQLMVGDELPRKLEFWYQVTRVTGIILEYRRFSN